MKKNARIASARTVTTTVNLIVASIPMMLIADEDDVEDGHQMATLFHHGTRR